MIYFSPHDMMMPCQVQVAAFYSLTVQHRKVLLASQLPDRETFTFCQFLIMRISQTYKQFGEKILNIVKGDKTVQNFLSMIHLKSQISVQLQECNKIGVLMRAKVMRN